MSYCRKYDYQPCSWSKFCNHFLITLRSLRQDASKYRKEGGRLRKGVEGERVQGIDKSFVTDLRSKNPFSNSNPEEEDIPISILIDKDDIVDSQCSEEEAFSDAMGKKNNSASNIKTSSSTKNNSKSEEREGSIEPKLDVNGKKPSLKEERKTKKTHGGKRAGAGRKKGSTNSKNKVSNILY